MNSQPPENMTSKSQASVDEVLLNCAWWGSDTHAGTTGKHVPADYNVQAKQQLKQLILGAVPQKATKPFSDMNMGYNNAIDQFEANINQLFEGEL